MEAQIKQVQELTEKFAAAQKTLEEVKKQTTPEASSSTQESERTVVLAWDTFPLPKIAESQDAVGNAKC